MTYYDLLGGSTPHLEYLLKGLAQGGGLTETAFSKEKGSLCSIKSKRWPTFASCVPGSLKNGERITQLIDRRSRSPTQRSLSLRLGFLSRINHILHMISSSPYFCHLRSILLQKWVWLVFYPRFFFRIAGLASSI